MSTVRCLHFLGIQTFFLRVFLLMLAIFLSSCISKKKSKLFGFIDFNSSSVPATFSVGGTVSGLSGKIIIQNNDTDSLEITSNGSFTFPTLLSDGATYSVKLILSEPTSQACTISNATGSVQLSDVTNILVTCTTIVPITFNYPNSPYILMRTVSITTITPTFSGASITNCTANPTLPAGLSLDASTCAISGTPTATQALTTYTISVTHSTGVTSTGISIRVEELTSVSVTYTGSPYTFTQGVAIPAVTPTVSGGSITACSASPVLPASLNLDATTCTITGTPTGTQALTAHTITATYSLGTTSTVIFITVNAPPSVVSVTYTGSPYTFTQGVAIPAVTPTVSGGSITACSASPVLPASLNLDATTCTITGTPAGIQSATAYTITASNPNGNTTASISIEIQAFQYTVSTFIFKNGLAINALSPVGTATITTCSSVPVLPAGLSLSSTCVISGTPTTDQAATTYTITATTAGGTPNTVISIEILTTVYRIFVTQSTYTGNLGGVSGADAKCEADANKPATGTYKAMLVNEVVNQRQACTSSYCTDSTQNIDWVMKPDTTYIRASDFAKLSTTNAAGIFRLDISPMTSSFAVGAQKSYWGGFSNPVKWATDSNHCQNWTSSTSGEKGGRGFSNSTDYTSIRGNPVPNCDLSLHLLCVEQ
jgi:hypothetical protein